MPESFSGLRIVITRPHHQAWEFGAALSQLGAEVIYLPVIGIEPPQDLEVLDRALSRLASYDWVISPASTVFGRAWTGCWLHQARSNGQKAFGWPPSDPRQPPP